MIKVLFVDDEPMMLRSLRRMLLQKAKDWQMKFVDSGKAALTLLEQQEIDIIVTDMRMPGMSGESLLAEVQKRYPHINRIVLSGHSDRELIIKSTRLAHQYIAKPCDSKTLIKILEQAIHFRSTLAKNGILDLVTKIDGLPSPNENVQKILECVQDEESSLADIGNLIAQDMGMSSNILKVVNSAFFGLPRHVGSVPEAVVLLGMDIIRALVLSHHFVSFFNFGQIPHFSYQMLWDHCIRTAIMCREITKAEINSKETIDNSFIAGLLHDIGKLILGYIITEKYTKIIEDARKSNLGIWKIETKNLGVSHSEIGAYLIGLWGVNNSIVDAIRCHHEPSKLNHKGDILISAVHLADIFDHQLFVFNEGYERPVIDHKYIAAEQLHEQVDKWFLLCKDHFSQ